MNENSKLLGEEKIPKLLTRLAVPATIGMIFNALYNLVDTIVLGRGVGHLAIGGLAISFPIQMIIMAFAMMIGIGAASAISRSLGAGNVEKADHIAGNAFLTIVILSTIMMAFGLTFLTPILKLFGATPELLPYAQEYMSVIFIGSIVFSSAVAGNNLIRSEGNAKAAMISMIIGTGMNIILDPLFVFYFNMGIRGAAIATIIAQFLSFIYVAHYFLSDRSTLKILPHHLIPDLEIIKEIMTVGFPSFMRQVAGSFLAIVINNSLSYYGGNIAISVYGIVNRVMMFILMPMFGTVQGFQPIAGFNYGAKKFDRVNEVIKSAIKRLVIYSTIGFLVIQLFPEAIISVFTQEAEVIELGTEVIRIIMLMIPIVGIQIISASLFQSLGKAKPALILSMLRQTLLLIPLVLILPRIFDFGLFGIWLAFPISDGISTILSVMLLLKEMKKMNDDHNAIDDSSLVNEAS